MVIFPKSVKSLEDQTLRHFSRATNFFQSYPLLKLPNHMRFVLHELSWKRVVVFFSELFSLDCWYRITLALGPDVQAPPPPPPLIENYRVFVGCSGLRILRAAIITWISDCVSVSLAHHLFLTDSLTLLFAWWLAADFMPWSTTVMIFSCIVPRTHYYARPMRFGSRGPRKFLKPRQTRHFVSLGAELLQAGELSITFPRWRKMSSSHGEYSTEDKEVNQAFSFYARFHCWKSFGLSFSFISLN